jgi:cardiolipin synthase
MDLWLELRDITNFTVVVLGLILSLWASGHALVYKRDSRAAVLWVGLIWLLPLAGAMLYFLLGVNRLRRWAESLRRDMQRLRAQRGPAVCPPEELARRFRDVPLDAAALARAVGRVAERPLLRGNRVDPLINGDGAYPAMLEAIDRARGSVSLSTYIFDADEVGREFASALGRAVRRGVQVRVLVDATGARYSWPTIVRFLRREGVEYARFLPTFPSWHLFTLNLRNHRKLLVADGRVGFTGGMNLRLGHCLQRNPRRPIQDIHFRVEGPVVAQFQEAFVEDWQFTTGEALRGPLWFPELSVAGHVSARGISDGPDEDFEKLRWTLLAAIATARRSIHVATPYFLPEPALIAALGTAAMRGVEVDILLPSRSNLPLVHNASRAHWWQMLVHGCRIWLSPPPFDHGKLMIVDDAWTLVGSANWDPRSLRLNFEFNVECYDQELAQDLDAIFISKRDVSQEVTLQQIDGRGLPIRLFDGAARLLTPYL